MPEAQVILDIAKDRLNDYLAPAVDSFSFSGIQLIAHFIDLARIVIDFYFPAVSSLGASAKVLACSAFTATVDRRICSVFALLLFPVAKVEFPVVRA